MPVDDDLNPVLGIDLGTTFSAIARWNARKEAPQAYQTHKGDDSLQSVVYFDPKTNETLVGEDAYKRGLRFPENMALGVKRKMDDASQKIVIGGRTFTPIELSARILERLYKDVEEKVPKGLFHGRGTVVTVPYYFKAHQCENTRKAAEMANIHCMGILQEPIAASLAYAWQLVQDQSDRELGENILVFDLGGGTFDLTLFRLEQTKDKLLFEVLATGGDDRLGGMDFDECLGELILKKAGVTLAGLAPAEERKARQRLIEQAIATKITLGASLQDYISIPDVPPGNNIDIELSRAEFESCIKRYVDKIEGIIEKLWCTANFKPADVDRVIRVGGSSKIPKMKDLLSEHIGESKVWSNTNPALCVAEGAAMYAAYLDDREVFGREIEVRTRTCHSLGVETAGGRFEVIIPANRKTPCELRKPFTFDADDMTDCDIKVYQGAASLVKGNALIGTIPVMGLPGRRKGELDIWVTFRVSEEQVLSVIVEAEGVRRTEAIKFA